MKLTRLQSLVWKTAVMIELVTLIVTFAKHADLRDPVIDAMLLVTVLVCAWLTRRWVASMPDEKIRTFRIG